MTAGIFILALIIVPAAICIAVILICNAITDYREKKKKQAHPWYFQKLDELDDLCTRSCKYYNAEIAPLKRLIDKILKDWDYYPAELRERKTSELEIYRRAIESHQQVCDNLDAEANKIRADLKEYNKIHSVYKEYE